MFKLFISNKQYVCRLCFSACRARERCSFVLFIRTTTKIKPETILYTFNSTHKCQSHFGRPKTIARFHFWLRNWCQFQNRNCNESVLRIHCECCECCNKQWLRSSVVVNCGSNGDNLNKLSYLLLVYNSILNWQFVVLNNCGVAHVFVGQSKRAAVYLMSNQRFCLGLFLKRRENRQLGKPISPLARTLIMLLKFETKTQKNLRAGNLVSFTKCT